MDLPALSHERNESQCRDGDIVTSAIATRKNLIEIQLHDGISHRRRISICDVFCNEIGERLDRSHDDALVLVAQSASKHLLALISKNQRGIEHKQASQA